MNAYEITFIVRPDLDEDQTGNAVGQVAGRLQAAGGEVIASFPWSPARRRMAYPIRDFGDGYYVTTTFRLDPEAIRDFENALKLNDNIVRFLVVEATDQMIRQSQQRMQQQQAATAPRPAPTTSVQPATESVEGAAPEIAAGQVEATSGSEARVDDGSTTPQPEPVTPARTATPTASAEE